MSEYHEFLEAKAHLTRESGFEATWLPDFLFDFQRSLTASAIRRGRCAIFADCGLGKTAMQLVYAENVRRHTGKRVLIATPLAVSHQTVQEGEKFGVEVCRSHDGRPAGAITVTNYERIHLFDPNEYVGVVCDESSILKNFEGRRRAAVTRFLRKIPYRLLCTATAAPNDYIELGTSAEALGVMGHVDMLGRFFKNDQNTIKPMAYRNRGTDFNSAYERTKWRLKDHAEIPFWRWVSSWSWALRKPSDLGFPDEGFALPDLIERQTVVEHDKALAGELFPRAAVTLREQREERRLTLEERCQMVAEIVNRESAEPFVVWCHLNDEGALLAKLIPDAVEVSGADSEDEKEAAFLAFGRGEIRVLVTKPRIGALGLNWQHCARMTFFPSHSFEQYYQGVRRCWRFGQTRPVTVDVITTKGEERVLANLQRKARAAEVMFAKIVEQMNDPLVHRKTNPFQKSMEVPSWLS